MKNFAVIGVHHHDPMGPKRLQDVLDDIMDQNAQWENAVVAFEYPEEADRLIPSIRQECHKLIDNHSGQEALAMFKNVPLYEVEITQQKITPSKVWWLEQNEANASDYAQIYSGKINQLWSGSAERDSVSLSHSLWKTAEDFVNTYGVDEEREIRMMERLAKRLGQSNKNHSEAVIVVMGAAHKDPIITVAKKMGFEKLRFRPGYFPYTEPSVEIEVYHPVKKEWLELGGAGMFRPEVVIPLLGKDIPVLAWGPGFDRTLLDYYKIHDIRDLYKNDLKFIRESKDWMKH